jgi:hypothetical protein
MSFGMIDDLVDCHIRDIRRQAAEHRIRAHHSGSRSAGGRDRWPRLRTRIGFTLVEAGLRLLPTTRSGPRDYLPLGTPRT